MWETNRRCLGRRPIRARDSDEGLSKSRASGRRPTRARDDDKGLYKDRAGRTVSAARGQLPRPASPGSAGVLTLGRPGLAPARFLAPPRALDASTRAARDDDKGLTARGACRTVSAAREQFPRPAAPGSAGVRGRPGAARTGRRDRS